MSTTEFDFFSPKHGPEELGEDVCPRRGAGKLARLQAWLYDGSQKLQFRFAPSIVLRSEAELFGVSSPRFAVRCYLTENSFVNGRRRAQLAAEIRFCYGADATAEVCAELQREAWIADSVLEPPADLVTAGFRFLTVDLSAAYGEPVPFQGTPFVAHIRHGGGMCAQAACFMALGLLHDRVRPLGGMADITVLATNAVRWSSKGLTAKNMESLFQHRIQGTNAQLQLAVIAAPEAVPPIVSDVAVAMKAYLGSRCPVIALVSLSRMFGNHRLHGETADPILVGTKDRVDRSEPSYRRRRAIPVTGVNPALPADEQRLNHAVVLVGWRDTDARDEFILNDPATFPFIPVTAEQLLDVRQYRSEPQDSQKKPPPPTADDLEPFWQCLPITPREVCVPLLDRWHKPSADAAPQLEPGLLSLARVVQGEASIDSPANLKYDLHRGETRFRLVDLRSGDDDWARLGAAEREGLADCARRAVEPEIYWAQYFNWGDLSGLTTESVWLWRASRPLNWLDPRSAVAAVVIRRSANDPWQTMYPLDAGRRVDAS